MAKRGKRKSATRRGGKSGGGSAFTWFGTGLILGLGIAVFAYMKGYLPERPKQPEPLESSLSSPEGGLLDSDDGAIVDNPGAQYDFFTVLPEMEVVVPERELSEEATPDTPQPAGGERFILQAGSFRNASDADQMKARLALLGAVASIQQVTVDNQTWHRVRIGPVEGVRAADQLRRQLQDNDIEVLVLRESS